MFFEPDGHHILAIDSPTSGESSLVFVWWGHLDVVVPGVGVHEVEKFVPRCCFHQLIDPWEGEAILWACFIKVSEVDADPLFAILLLHEDGIGEQVGIVGLSDEVGLQ